MHLKQFRFGLTLLSLAEDIEPDIEQIVANAAAKGGRPLLRDEWPAIRDALDKAVKGPAGDLRL